MAKYTVTRSCGHVETVALVGKIKDREWRLEHVEEQKLCSECWKAELKRRHEEENQEAAEAAKDNGLPALTGSAKQVPWAETIRLQMIAEFEELIYRRVPREKRGDVLLVEALESVKRSRTSARWWIDNRFAEGYKDLLRILDMEIQEKKMEEAKPPKEVVLNAKAEATIRPENPKTETVAEIRALENSVEISFPEKRDDFRELVKEKLHMKWADGCWKRSLNTKNGTAADRAAEAGHRLLAAGFPIRIFDEEIREKAITGTYEPECTRWIMVRNEDAAYAGWFAIVWAREEDFYKAAKKIAGAKYSRPHVVVPPEQFEEVLDFAKMYGFKVSTWARELIENARTARENMLVVKVDLPKEPEKVSVSGRPPVLEVPAEVGVADEFRD